MDNLEIIESSSLLAPLVSSRIFQLDAGIVGAALQQFQVVAGTDTELVGVWRVPGRDLGREPEKYHHQSEFLGYLSYCDRATIEDR